MVLKTLGKTTWSDIEVGEVFAWEGCWAIVQKRSKAGRILWLAESHDNTCPVGLEETNSTISWPGDFAWELYKLPKSVQNLWRED